MRVQEITLYRKDFMSNGKIQQDKKMFRYFVRLQLEDAKVTLKVFRRRCLVIFGRLTYVKKIWTSAMTSILTDVRRLLTDVGPL